MYKELQTKLNNFKLQTKLYYFFSIYNFQHNRNITQNLTII